MSAPKTPLAALLAAFGLLFAACAPQAAPAETPSSPALTPYRSPTPTAPPPQVTPGPNSPGGLPPSGPTPTPFVYVVRQGDTLSGIASRFGVPLEQLQAANPAVDPRFLTVGAALIIPTGGEDPASVLPTPTPPALQLAAPSCFSSAEGALTCFVPAGNPGPLGLENVAARVSLVDASGAVVASETALLPLNLLPPGQSLPLVASFSPPVPPWAHAEIQLLSALPVADSGERYVPVEVGDSRVAISPDGLSAVVSGALALSAGSESAAEVWLAALALDSEGRVVGVRRWESATPLLAGGSLEFTLNLYSLSGRIAAVALYAEARPE